MSDASVVLIVLAAVLVLGLLALALVGLPDEKRAAWVPLPAYDDSADAEVGLVSDAVGAPVGWRSCQDGGRCRTWFTCGRAHALPSVDHSQKNCPLDYLACIGEHYRHDCAHDFRSGPVVHVGGHSVTASCACGLTAHDRGSAGVAAHAGPGR